MPVTVQPTITFSAPMDAATISRTNVRLLLPDGTPVAHGSGSPTLDVTGKVILPGFLEAHSARGMDQSNERNNNVPFLSVLDAIDPGQEYFEDCRRNGVTTVAIVPGDDTMIGGPNTDSCNGGLGTDTATTCETILAVP